MRRLRLTFLAFLLATGPWLAAQTIGLSGVAAGVSGNAVVGGVGTAVVLTSITVAPPNPVIPYNASQSFTANGAYSDGSQSDITSQAAWSSSNPAIATNSGPNFQCVARGIVTVSAILSSVTGTTTLNCQSPTFTPTGPFTVPQGTASVTIVQFTGANGSSPFTFSLSGAPGWISLSNTGCAGSQVNCSLVGAMNGVAVGVYNFSLQITDNIANTACAAPGCPISVNVIATSAEDNTYCNASEVVIGLAMDGPAHPLTACNNTAIANTAITSNGNDGQTVFVCPVGQLNGGVAVSGCSGAPQPTIGGSPPACWQPGAAGTPWYCSTIQSALNQVWATTGCGSWIRIYENLNLPNGAQNIYTEPTVVSPGNLNCGPDYSQPWVWISTRNMNAAGVIGTGGAALSPGNRITPAWVGQASIVGRPSYAQTGTSQIFLPMWRCEQSGTLCTTLNSQMLNATGKVTTDGSTTVTWVSGTAFTTGTSWNGLQFTIASTTYTIASVTDNHHLVTTVGVPAGTNSSFALIGGAVLNGVRMMGIMPAAPHGRNTSLDLYGNNICGLNGNGTAECTPGSVGSMLTIGCGTLFQGGVTVGACTITSPSQGRPAALPHGTGSQHFILDRILASGCDDITMASCYDTMETLVQMVNGQHLSLIDSYLIHGYCMFAIGPCVEGHGAGGGNPQMTVNDTGTKLEDDFIESTGENFFYGGGTATAGIYPTDIEVRHNHFWKPLTWKADNQLFVGKVQDTFVSKGGGSYGGTIGCTIDAPRSCSSLNACTAACQAIVVSGAIADVTIPQGTVNTSGTGVAWVSGTQFFSGMAGKGINISGTSYAVATYNSATSLTLGASAGAQTGVPYDTKGANYGLYDKGNGNTYPAIPNLYFTDGGQTFTSCKGQIGGNVNTTGGSGTVTANGTTTVLWVSGAQFIADGTWNGVSIVVNGTTYTISSVTDATHLLATTNVTTGAGVSYVVSDVKWVHGNKFIAGLVGTSVTINGSSYTVAAFTSNIQITLSAPTSPEPQANVTYASNLPDRGDCVHAVIGLPNIKNLSEFKHGIRVLWEGNIHENVFKGQSDQDAFCVLLTPKNPNNNCPTCTVQDVTMRYNLCRNTVKGMQISAVEATQGGGLSQYMKNVSIHDMIFDGMNGWYWTAGTAPFSGGSGTCMNIENVQNPTYATANIKINHVDCLHSIATLASAQLTSAAALAIFFNVSNTVPAIMPGITFENSIAAGGAKNTASHNFGNINCLNNGCTDHAGHQPSETTLRQILSNDFDGPVIGGVYTTNHVVEVKLTEGGTCSVFPTSVTLDGGGGSGANAAFFTGTLNTAHKAIVKLWANFPGQNYTLAPTAAFHGQTCTLQPAATVLIAGAGNAGNSGSCFDHNIMPLQAWQGLGTMAQYPAHQTDPINNACDCTNGGHNNTTAATASCSTTGVNYNVCKGVAGQGPCSWQDVNFVNFALDANGAELPTGDLHLAAGSLGHLAANDGTDIGANVDLVLGKSDGSAPSPYTGITINPSTGMAVLPQ